MPRRRGRPKGLKNKRTTTYVSAGDDDVVAYGYLFVSKKEQDDYELALKLRNDGVINEPGMPFEISDQKEIEDLVGRGVFQFVRYNAKRHAGIRIFKSRMVREVKGKTTLPYEKSRLVVRGYNDRGK